MTNTGTQVSTETKPTRSVLVDMSIRYGMEAAAFEATVRATCMRPDKYGNQPSNAEFAAFLLVAKEYKLNPLLKEIYAFPAKGGGIVPVVSIDGWVNLINSHPQCDGFEFAVEHDDRDELVSMTCTMYRKDRSRPILVTEYLVECVRNTEPWAMKHRMLRHKTLIQCARYAFGFSGIYDPDEAEVISMREVNDRPAIGDAPAPDEDGTVVAQTTKAKAEPRKKADAKPKEDGIDKANAEDATIIPGDDVSKGGKEDSSASENSEADNSNAADDLNPPAPDDDVADDNQVNDNKKDDFKGKIEEARQKSAAAKSLIPDLPEGTAASVVKWFADHNRIWAKAKTLEEFRSVWSSRATIALSEQEVELVKTMRDNHKKRIEAEIEQAANKETPPVPEGSEFDYPEFKSVFEEGLAKCKTPDDVNRLASDLHAPPLSDALTAENQEELKELVLARMDQLESFDK